MNIARMVVEHHDGIPVQIGNTDGLTLEHPVQEIETNNEDILNQQPINEDIPVDKEQQIIDDISAGTAN